MKIKIEKRPTLSNIQSVFVTIISLLVSILIMGIILTVYFAFDKNLDFGGALKLTAESYVEMFYWPFFDQYGIQSTFLKMIPLSFVALGLIFAYRLKIWNIGGEGQLYMGAMAATYGALFLFKDVNNPIIMILLLIFMGAIGGGLWAAIPAFMKAFFKTDEIVITLMLNYIAIFFVDYLVYGPWKNPEGYGFPGTAPFPDSANLPYIGNSDIHIGIIFVIILAVIMTYIFKKTKWGFNSKIVGDNKDNAKYAGINVKFYTIISLVISGIIAGIGGAVQMMGTQHSLQHGFSPGYGFTAIIIAWLAKLNPISVLLTGFLFGGLLVGTDSLQMFYGVPTSLVDLFQGLVLFCLLGGEAIAHYKVVFREKEAIV
ncbi:MAG: ral nucleoside transport system permease protein [Kosmotogales bacterium]|nr:ral nucleoside transport system permease protein [Kosmotogales bacterium]